MATYYEINSIIKDRVPKIVNLLPEIEMSDKEWKKVLKKFKRLILKDLLPWMIYTVK